MSDEIRSIIEVVLKRFSTSRKSVFEVTVCQDDKISKISSKIFVRTTNSVQTQNFEQILCFSKLIVEVFF